MKHIRWLPALAILTLGCGISNDQLAAALTQAIEGVRVPFDVRIVCSEQFRDVDIQSIIITINTDIDAGVTMQASIEAADEACTAGADALLSAAMDAEDSGAGGFTFTALDAAVYRTDCLNCYIVIIDRLYDEQ